MQRGRLQQSEPAFITYLKGGTNRGSLCSYTELSGLMLNVFVVMWCHLDLQINVTESSLVNAPSLEQGILDCISIQAKKVKGMPGNLPDSTKLACWQTLIYIYNKTT